MMHAGRGLIFGDTMIDGGESNRIMALCYAFLLRACGTSWRFENGEM